MNAVRSAELMNADDSALLVVDVQEKLIPLVEDSRRIIWNIGRLLDAANILGVRSAVSEQYPKGLGTTVAELAQKLGKPAEKLAFSCRDCNELFEPLIEAGVCKLLVAGIETHVCVQQTVLDLLAADFRVYVAVDAVGSRGRIDYETALRRMEISGATLTTTEAAMFEWCETSGTPQFKQISQLVRQPAP